MHHPDTFVPSSVGVPHVQCWVWGPWAAGGAAAHACTEMKLGGIEVVATALVAQVRCVGEGEKGCECCTGWARTGEVWPPVQWDVLCGFLCWLVVVAHSVLIAAPCSGQGGVGTEQRRTGAHDPLVLRCAGLIPGGRMWQVRTAACTGDRGRVCATHACEVNDALMGSEC